MLKRYAALACLLLLTSCARDDGDDTASASDPSSAAESETGSETETETETSDTTALDNGGFGDLEGVCSEGDPGTAAAEPGLTDRSIRVGTITDKSASFRPGLNEEMYDAAVAFGAWCNGHGGLGGRELIISDRDAALFNYDPVITTACAEDFALVGGGAVFDQDDSDIRVGCGLPNIAGYVVSTRSRVADLQVQPLPNPVYQANVGRYLAADRITDGGMGAFGILAGAVPSVLVVRDINLEAVGLTGGEAAYSAEFNAQGESNWAPFVEDMKNAGVRVLEFVGEPQFLTNLQKAMNTADWYPELTIQGANFYDRTYLEEGGATARNTIVFTGFHPFELADDNKATADYLELMERYNPGGKVAALGMQTISSFLLFATAVNECGAGLSRACLLAEAGVIDEWTGGGLHAESSPATNTAPKCFLVMELTPDGFVYAEDETQPTDGLFNCDPGNVVELQNDYGVPR